MAQETPPKPTSLPPQGGGGGSGWIGIIGSVAGSIIDALSQRSANTANARNVDKQIAFQKEQSETQYQRAVTDMRAAGLNPALAYKQGGNQAESGAAAQAQPLTAGNQLQRAVDAYNQLANGTAQRALMREQAATQAAQTRKTWLEGSAIQPDAILGQNTEYINQHQRTRLAKGRGEEYIADRTPQDWEANMKSKVQGTATAKQQEHLMNTQATLNEQEYMNAWFRKNIAPYINSTARAAKGMRDITTATGVTPIRRYY